MSLLSLFNEDPYQVERWNGNWIISVNYMNVNEDGQPTWFDWSAMFFTGDDRLFSASPYQAYQFKHKTVAKFWAWLWNREWMKRGRVEDVSFSG